MVEDKDRNTIRFETKKWMDMLHYKLGLSGSIGAIGNMSLWKIGDLIRGNITTLVLFAAERADSLANEKGVTSTLECDLPIIVLTPFMPSSISLPPSITGKAKILDINDYLSVEDGNIKVYSKRFSQRVRSAFRTVSFETDGRLMYQGCTIRQYDIGTETHAFLHALARVMDRGVDCDTIYLHAQQHCKKYGKILKPWKTAKSFCQTIKSRIANDLEGKNKDVVDSIITCTKVRKDLSHYKMRSDL